MIGPSSTPGCKTRRFAAVTLRLIPTTGTDDTAAVLRRHVEVESVALAIAVSIGGNQSIRVIQRTLHDARDVSAHAVAFASRKWHAAKCPGVTSVIFGSSTEQRLKA